jgi:hypothetical protein
VAEIGVCPMNTYRISFYKDLLNSDGHSFKCLQRQIDVQSTGPSQALAAAEQLIDNARLNADCVEVMQLPDGHCHFEQSFDRSPARCGNIWSPGS